MVKSRNRKVGAGRISLGILAAALAVFFTYHTFKRSERTVVCNQGWGKVRAGIDLQVAIRHLGKRGPKRDCDPVTSPNTCLLEGYPRPDSLPTRRVLVYECRQRVLYIFVDKGNKVAKVWWGKKRKKEGSRDLPPRKLPAGS